MTQDLEGILRAKLEAAFSPRKLVITNQSAAHHGHAGSPQTGQSHYHVQIRSAKFQGLTLVQQHRLVYQVLADELAGPIHALALDCSAEASL